MEEDERGEMCNALWMLWPSSIYERLMTTGRPASKSLPSDGGGDKRPSDTKIETMTSTNPSLIYEHEAGLKTESMAMTKLKIH